jgi:hypothetical protein
MSQISEAKNVARQWMRANVTSPEFGLESFAEFYAHYTVRAPGHVGWADKIEDFYLAWEQAVEP